VIRALALAALVLGGPAFADTGTPPKRIINATVFGDDPCPGGKPDEIIVCARQPEAERYRIPKPLRDPPEIPAASQAWANRAATIDEVNRTGLPNSCSPVGAGGQTGCTLDMLRRWKAEQQAKARADETAKAP
jgi:hypothetical protein